MGVKISIITATYNSGKTLENTIYSIRKQTYKNIEYIVIDGKSVDNTIDILKSNLDIVSNYISESDKGVYDALNKGLELASGDFLLVLGSDDILYSDTVIESIASKLSNDNYIYYGNVLWKGTNHIHWGKFHKLKWAWSNISHQAIFYPKSVYKQYKYDLRYKLYADYAYNLKLLQEKNKFVYIDEIIALYAMDGVSASLKDEEFDKDSKFLIYSALGFVPAALYFIKNIMLKYKKMLFNGKS